MSKLYRKASVLISPFPPEQLLYHLSSFHLRAWEFEIFYTLLLKSNHKQSGSAQKQPVITTIFFSFPMVYLLLLLASFVKHIAVMENQIFSGTAAPGISSMQCPVFELRKDQENEFEWSLSERPVPVSHWTLYDLNSSSHLLFDDRRLLKTLLLNLYRILTFILLTFTHLSFIVVILKQTVKRNQCLYKERYVASLDSSCTNWWSQGYPLNCFDFIDADDLVSAEMIKISDLLSSSTIRLSFQENGASAVSMFDAHAGVGGVTTSGNSQI